MDIDEEVYYVQYLYNSVSEYIWFLIKYIEQQGHANISDASQYLRFFKQEIHEFIFMFQGETYLEKFCNMLCTTSKAFVLSDEQLFLSALYKSFKENIFENLVITKSADLILKGIYKMQDICHNLNLSNVIHIEVKELVNILPKYPYFEIQNKSCVSLIQLHGLFGFDNHCYEAVVCYFQSFLQNTKVLSFNEVTFHGAFVPSCGVQNVLVVFCILFTCKLFKCKNSMVSLRVKPKKKSLENKPLDIKLFAAQLLAKVPIGLLIYEAYGSHLHDWVGEVGKLKQNSGYIYCVVNFSDEMQSSFLVYFNQAAIKQVCEVENLEDYVKINDCVKFDAIHCFEARSSNICWKATKLQIINMPSKISKRLSRIQHCETILSDYRYMKDKCIHPKCSLKNFHGNEYDVKKLTYCSPKSLRNECTCKDLEMHIMSKDLKDWNCFLEKSQVELLLNEKCFHKTETSREKCSLCSNSLATELSLSDKCSSDLNSSASETGANISYETSEYNESDNCSKKFLKQSNNLLLNKNTCSYILNFMFFEYAFMIGKVTSVMLDKGTAIVTHKNKCYNIFFRKEAIFPSSECQKVFQIGRKILIFVPYLEEKKTIQVATLIHPLDSLETAEIEMSIVHAKELTLNSFFMKIINNVRDVQLHEHYFPVGFLLSNVFYDSKFLDYKKILVMNSDFEDDLSKLFSFSNGMYHMLVWIVLYVIYETSFKNLKPITSLFSLLSYVASYFNIKKNSVGPCVLRKKLCCIGKRKLQDENDSGIRELKRTIINMKENCSRFIASQHQDLDSLMGLELEPQIECEKNLKNNCSSSLNTYKTCGSLSSLDTFHSCESLIDETISAHDNQFISNCEVSFSTGHDSQALPSINTKDNIFLLSDTTKINSSSMSISELKDTETKSTNLQTNISKNFIQCKDKSVRRISPFGILKLKSLPVLKHKLKRRKISSIKLGVYNCGHFQVIKTTASVSVITDTCIFLRVKYKDFDTLLGYPTKVIPKEVKEKLKLNTVIEIEVIPNMPLHFSHILSIKMCATS